MFSSVSPDAGPCVVAKAIYKQFMFFLHGPVLLVSIIKKRKYMQASVNLNTAETLLKRVTLPCEERQTIAKVYVSQIIYSIFLRSLSILLAIHYMNGIM